MIKFISRLFNRHSEPATDNPPERPAIRLGGYNLTSEKEALATIKSALASGADPDKTYDRMPPLHLVCRNGFLSAAEMLLKGGATLELAGEGGATPFIEAASGVNPSLMRMLIDMGANVKAQDKNGHDALYQFIHWPCIEVTKGADYEARDKECFQLLLDQGLTLDHYEMSTIYTRRKHLIPMVPELLKVQEFEALVKSENLPEIENWLKKRTPADYGADYGATSPLGYATEKNNLKMMGLLMDWGADIESWWGGMTPIMTAAYAGSKEAFTKLLNAGADTTKLFAYDRYPDTTLPEVADLGKHEGMRAFVEEAIAHRGTPQKEKKLPPPDVSVHHEVKLEKRFKLKPMLALA